MNVQLLGLWTQFLLKNFQSIKLYGPLLWINYFEPEADVRMCSVEKLFLKILQNSQEKPVPESLL